VVTKPDETCFVQKTIAMGSENASFEYLKSFVCCGFGRDPEVTSTLALRSRARPLGGEIHGSLESRYLVKVVMLLLLHV
jgi:hypothetical protein